MSHTVVLLVVFLGLAGDLLTICGLFCWGAYTVGAKGLLDRHSPLEVTGYSMAIGTVPFVLVGLGELRRLDPDVKALLCSGSLSGKTAEYLALGFRAVLAKPYSLGALRSVVEGVVPQPQPDR